MSSRSPGAAIPPIGVIKRAEVFEFTKNIPQNDTETAKQDLPFPPHAVEVFIVAPAQANGNVELTVMAGSEQVIPSGDQDNIAPNNDVQKAFLLVNLDIPFDDEWEVQFDNTDTTQGHFFNVYLTAMFIDVLEGR